jgi:hypothetical protein
MMALGRLMHICQAVYGLLHQLRRSDICLERTGPAKQTIYMPLLTELRAFGWIVAIDMSLLAELAAPTEPRMQRRKTFGRSRGANRASPMSPIRRFAHSPFRCLRSRRLRANS